MAMRQDSKDPGILNYNLTDDSDDEKNNDEEYEDEADDEIEEPKEEPVIPLATWPLLSSAEDAKAFLVDLEKIFGINLNIPIAPDGHIPNSKVRRLPPYQPINGEIKQVPIGVDATYVRNVALSIKDSVSSGVEINEMFRNVVERYVQQHEVPVTDVGGVKLTKDKKKKKKAKRNKSPFNPMTIEEERYEMDDTYESIMEMMEEKRKTGEKTFVQKKKPKRRGKNMREEMALRARQQEDESFSQALLEGHRPSYGALDEGHLFDDDIHKTIYNLAMDLGGWPILYKNMVLIRNRDKKALSQMRTILQNDHTLTEIYMAICEPPYAFDYLQAHLGSAAKVIDAVDNALRNCQIAKQTLASFLSSNTKADHFVTEFQNARSETVCELKKLCSSEQSIPFYRLLDESLRGIEGSFNTLRRYLDDDSLFTNSILTNIKECDAEKNKSLIENCGLAISAQAESISGGLGTDDVVTPRTGSLDQMESLQIDSVADQTITHISTSELSSSTLSVSQNIPSPLIMSETSSQGEVGELLEKLPPLPEFSTEKWQRHLAEKLCVVAGNKAEKEIARLKIGNILQLDTDMMTTVENSYRDFPVESIKQAYDERVEVIDKLTPYLGSKIKAIEVLNNALNKETEACKLLTKALGSEEKTDELLDRLRGAKVKVMETLLGTVGESTQIGGSDLSSMFQFDASIRDAMNVALTAACEESLLRERLRAQRFVHELNIDLEKSFHVLGDRIVETLGQDDEALHAAVKAAITEANPTTIEEVQHLVTQFRQELTESITNKVKSSDQVKALNTTELTDFMYKVQKYLDRVEAGDKYLLTQLTNALMDAKDGSRQHKAKARTHKIPSSEKSSTIIELKRKRQKKEHKKVNKIALQKVRELEQHIDSDSPILQMEISTTEEEPLPVASFRGLLLDLSKYKVQADDLIKLENKLSTMPSNDLQNMCNYLKTDECKEELDPSIIKSVLGFLEKANKTFGEGANQDDRKNMINYISRQIKNEIERSASDEKVRPVLLPENRSDRQLLKTLRNLLADEQELDQDDIDALLLSDDWKKYVETDQGREFGHGLSHMKNMVLDLDKSRTSTKRKDVQQIAKSLKAAIEAELVEMEGLSYEIHGGVLETQTEDEETTAEGITSDATSPTSTRAKGIQEDDIQDAKLKAISITPTSMPPKSPTAQKKKKIPQTGEIAKKKDQAVRKIKDDPNAVEVNKLSTKEFPPEGFQIASEEDWLMKTQQFEGTDTDDNYSAMDEPCRQHKPSDKEPKTKESLKVHSKSPAKSTSDDHSAMDESNKPRTKKTTIKLHSKTPTKSAPQGRIVSQGKRISKRPKDIQDDTQPQLAIQIDQKPTSQKIPKFLEMKKTDDDVDTSSADSVDSLRLNEPRSMQKLMRVVSRTIEGGKRGKPKGMLPKKTMQLKKSPREAASSPLRKLIHLPRATEESTSRENKKIIILTKSHHESSTTDETNSVERKVREPEKKVPSLVQRDQTFDIRTSQSPTDLFKRTPDRSLSKISTVSSERKYFSSVQTEIGSNPPPSPSFLKRFSSSAMTDSEFEQQRDTLASGQAVLSPTASRHSCITFTESEVIMPDYDEQGLNELQAIKMKRVSPETGSSPGTSRTEFSTPDIISGSAATPRTGILSKTIEASTKGSKASRLDPKFSAFSKRQWFQKLEGNVLSISDVIKTLTKEISAAPKPNRKRHRALTSDVCQIDKAFPLPDTLREAVTSCFENEFDSIVKDELPDLVNRAKVSKPQKFQYSTAESDKNLFLMRMPSKRDVKDITTKLKNTFQRAWNLMEGLEYFKTPVDEQNKMMLGRAMKHLIEDGCWSVDDSADLKMGNLINDLQETPSPKGFFRGNLVGKEEVTKLFKDDKYDTPGICTSETGNSIESYDSKKELKPTKIGISSAKASDKTLTLTPEVVTGTANLSSCSSLLEPGVNVEELRPKATRITAPYSPPSQRESEKELQEFEDLVSIERQVKSPLLYPSSVSADETYHMGPTSPTSSMVVLTDNSEFRSHESTSSKGTESRSTTVDTGTAVNKALQEYPELAKYVNRPKDIKEYDESGILSRLPKYYRTKLIKDSQVWQMVNDRNERFNKSQKKKIDLSQIPKLPKFGDPMFQRRLPRPLPPIKESETFVDPSTKDEPYETEVQEAVAKKRKVNTSKKLDKPPFHRDSSVPPHDWGRITISKEDWLKEDFVCKGHHQPGYHCKFEFFCKQLELHPDAQIKVGKNLGKLELMDMIHATIYSAAKKRNERLLKGDLSLADLSERLNNLRARIAKRERPGLRA